MTPRRRTLKHVQPSTLPVARLLSLLRQGRARLEVAHYRRFAVTIPGREFPALFITVTDEDDVADGHDAYTIDEDHEKRCLTESEADNVAEIVSALHLSRQPEIVTEGVD